MVLSSIHTIQKVRIRIRSKLHTYFSAISDIQTMNREKLSYLSIYIYLSYPTLYVLGFSGGLSVFLLERKRIPAARKPMRATPPTTPPAIAPALTEGLGFGEDERVAVTMTVMGAGGGVGVGVGMLVMVKTIPSRLDLVRDEVVLVGLAIDVVDGRLVRQRMLVTSIGLQKYPLGQQYLVFTEQRVY